MPDTLLTRQNIREHLRKYLWIYIVAVVVALLVTNLLWMTTAPQVPGEQTVLIYMADTVSNPDALSDVADDMLVRGQAFDDTLRKVEFQTLMFSRDEGDYTSMMVLLTRLSTGEGDAWMACGPAMDALAQSEALMPLDDFLEAGWLSEYGLEPWYATLTDEETGESRTFCAGLRLDKVTALTRRMAFQAEDTFLALSAGSDNLETTMKALEIMLEDLTREGGAAQ